MQNSLNFRVEKSSLLNKWQTSMAIIRRQDFSEGGGWRVTGDGWRVAGGGWRVAGDG